MPQKDKETSWVVHTTKNVESNFPQSTGRCTQGCKMIAEATIYIVEGLLETVGSGAKNEAVDLHNKQVRDLRGLCEGSKDHSGLGAATIRLETF